MLDLIVNGAADLSRKKSRAEAGCHVRGNALPLEDGQGQRAKTGRFMPKARVHHLDEAPGHHCLGSLEATRGDFVLAVDNLILGNRRQREATAHLVSAGKQPGIQGLDSIRSCSLGGRR